jgi:hypothetical protein
MKWWREPIGSTIFKSHLTLRGFVHHHYISLLCVNEMELEFLILRLGISNGGLMDNALVFKGVDALKQIILGQTSSRKQCRNCSQLRSK